MWIYVGFFLFCLKCLYTAMGSWLAITLDNLACNSSCVENRLVWLVLVSASRYAVADSRSAAVGFSTLRKGVSSPILSSSTSLSELLFSQLVSVSISNLLEMWPLGFVLFALRLLTSFFWGSCVGSYSCVVSYSSSSTILRGLGGRLLLSCAGLWW